MRRRLVRSETSQAKKAVAKIEEVRQYLIKRYSVHYTKLSWKEQTDMALRVQGLSRGTLQKQRILMQLIMGPATTLIALFGWLIATLFSN